MTNKITNMFSELWDVALTMIEYIGEVFDWLFDDLVIEIPLKIPLLIPDGLKWETGVTPISLLGVGLVAMVIYWFVWGR